MVARAAGPRHDVGLMPMIEGPKDASARIHRDVRRSRQLLLGGMLLGAVVGLLACFLPHDVPHSILGRGLLVLLLIAIGSLVLALLLRISAIWRLRALLRLSQFPGARVVQRGGRRGA